MASVETDVSLNPANNTENVSPAKKSKTDDIRAKLKEWQQEHGRARATVLPWQRPPLRKDPPTKKEGKEAELEKSIVRKPFSLRQDTSSVTAKVDCKWAAGSDVKFTASRVKKNDAPTNEMPTSGQHPAQAAIEALEKLPKGFNLAQWRAARRAHYAERVREQENKRRQTLAAALHTKPSAAAVVPEVRRQTMAVTRKRVAPLSIPSNVAAMPATGKGLTSKLAAGSKPPVGTNPTSKAPIKRNVDVQRHFSTNTKPSVTMSNVKLNTQLVKPRTFTPKPSTSAAPVVKRPPVAVPKLKRLAPKSPASKVTFNCVKTSRPPSAAKKPSPKLPTKSKSDRRKSAFKPVGHVKPTLRSTLLKAVPSVKPKPAQQPAEKKGKAEAKKVSVTARHGATSHRVSLSALHRKGGRHLVKAKEGMVREVKAQTRKSKAEAAKKDTPVDITTMSVKKSRSVSFYVPVAEDDRPCTPDDSLRRERLENWLNSKGRSGESYRHGRCFHEQVTPVLSVPRSVRGRPQTPGVPKLAVQQATPANQSSTIDRRLTIDLNTPVPLNWDESPTLKEPHCINGASSPDKTVKEDSPCVDGEPASQLAATPDLQATLSELVDSLHGGTPYFEVSEKLDELCETSPQVQKVAKYWLCRAEVAERAGNDGEVLRLLQLAFDHGAEPMSELRAACDALHQQQVQVQSSFCRTPRRRRHADLGGICESSIIRFKVATPSAKKTLAGNVFPITPVRRSVRLSQSAAKSLKPVFESQCVDSIDELPSQLRRSIVFKPNEALSAWDITVDYVPHADSDVEA